ncbi:hypothetical protein [Jeotgalibaca caeni]|uniref:hypothetical protein n=1 Tax=Jeotgalibaca caeni TaxID=3028623 RepID=UPI00237D384C|nr:hypothetical protein [Jeotgalibaca caeni]MDE1549483.1 hypothetical protein [Jeotgalibaca caeni]
MGNDNSKVVKIDRERYMEIKIYAAVNDLRIVDIVNLAVDEYLKKSEDFDQFKQKYLAPETKKVTIPAEDYEKLKKVAKENNIDIS